MLELADKDIKTVTLTTLPKYKLSGRDMEDIKKTHIELLEMKTTMCEMENTVYEINGILAIAKEKSNELEDITTETIQN